MATRSFDIPVSESETVFQELRRQIEELFDSLIEKVNERREVLLRQLKRWEEVFNITRINSIQSLETIERERDEIEECLSKLKINEARRAMEKGIMDLRNKIIEKEKKLTNPQIELVYDIHDLELKISKFGLLTDKIVNVLVENYKKLSKPVKVFGRFGRGIGKFSQPRGFVIDNVNERIFIADRENSSIQVWSMEEVYLFQFGEDILDRPWEMVVCNNFIYISNGNGDFLSKWSLDTFTQVKKSNTPKGSAPGNLKFPTGLDVDKGELFVVEVHNNRISVFDLNLKFKKILANNAIEESYCLRVRNDTIYVVERTGVIKLFSKTDQLLKTIPKLPVLKNFIFHFNFDLELDFLITVPFQNSLFILSPEGELIHSLDFSECGTALKEPFGISSFQDGRIFICFQNGSNAIAIF